MLLGKLENHTHITDFLPSKNCYGFFFHETLYKHEQACMQRAENSGSNTALSLRSSWVLLNVAVANGSFDDVCKLLLSNVNRDESHITIRNDQSLLLYGAVQLRKTGPCRYGDIRGSLKTLARLLMDFRWLKKVNDVRAKYLVMRENFDITLQAALNLAGFQVLRKN